MEGWYVWKGGVCVGWCVCRVVCVNGWCEWRGGVCVRLLCVEGWCV